MLSIEKCQEILNKKENNYTREEIIEIREKLYVLSEMLYAEKILQDEKSKEQESFTIQKS